MHQQGITTAIPHLGNNQGLSTALHPAQMDINNSAFSSQRENLPFPQPCLKAKRESSLPVALLVTPTQTSPLSDLPKPLVLPNLQTGGFLCVQGIVSSRGLSVSHLNPAVDSVATRSTPLAALSSGMQQGHEAEPQGWHRNPPPE